MQESDDRGLMESAMPAGMWRALEQRGQLRRRGRGRTLVGEGERSTDVFLILEGEAQVLLYSPNGREVSVRQLGPGALFGELAALDGAPRCASVVAATDLRVVAVTRADFLAVLEDVPQGKDWVVRRLVGEVRLLTERVFELSALNVQSRLHCELLRLARAGLMDAAVRAIRPAPTHAELANRIGTHREAVTRELKALADRNIIRTRRRTLEFIDLAGLEAEVSHAIGATGDILRASLSA